MTPIYTIKARRTDDGWEVIDDGPEAAAAKFAGFFVVDGWSREDFIESCEDDDADMDLAEEFADLWHWE